MHGDDKHQIKENACFWDGGTGERAVQETTTISKIIFARKSWKNNYEQYPNAT